MSINIDPAGPRLSLNERKFRTEAVLAQFRGKAFGWKGRSNCVHLARAQLAAFGHAPPPVPQFTTPIGAKRALHRRGFDSLEALLDSMLPRITPASAWIGDFVLMPGKPFGALTIAAGGGFVMGWHEEDLSRMHAVKVSATDAIGAWRL